MALWFLTIAVLGAVEDRSRSREILLALNPWHGVKFFLANGKIGFLALGAIVLAVTGAEALYADMGHFGKRPIRVAWFSLVLPALLLNYMGQGALLLREPGDDRAIRSTSSRRTRCCCRWCCWRRSPP